MEHLPVKQHMLLPLSRSAFTAAVFSCVVHICALGLSGAMMLTQGEHILTPIKVAILQQAVPLPVGEKEAHGANEPAPAAPPTPVPPPPVKPEPKTKKTPEKPLRPLMPPVKKPPPKVVTAPLPSEPLPQPSAFTLPAENAIAAGANQDNDGAAEGSASGSRKTGSGAQSEAGRGGIPGGTSARPDYGFNPKPPYPLIARRMGAQGIVLLRVHVRADGSVAKAEVKQSSGSGLLDDSALRTVRENWRFMPARLDGVPVESWVEVPIRFVLGDA
jgi:protein TonB